MSKQIEQAEKQLRKKDKQIEDYLTKGVEKEEIVLDKSNAEMPTQVLEQFQKENELIKDQILQYDNEIKRLKVEIKNSKKACCNIF
jgi:hypothetical protein